MIHRRDSRNASIAAALAVVMLALAVGVPLLDLGRDPSRLAFSDGQAPAGWVDHDHGLCAMHGAAAWSPAASLEPPTAPVTLDGAAPDDLCSPASRGAASFHRSRAPPVG